MEFLPLIAVLFLILGAEFVNGWTDAPNSIATVIATKVLSPRQAVLMAAVFNFLGVLSGTAVATVIGKGIVESELINLTTIATAMLGIIIWSTLAWRFGLPTSESHALVAGLTGAAMATNGISAIVWAGWNKVLIGLLFSSFLGLGGGFFIMNIIYLFFAKASRQTVSKIFGKLQILSAAFMAFGHGSNDGQKFIGTFALALLVGGILPIFKIPLFVILICAAIMTIGTATGGWRIIKTIGLKLTKLEPVHGFAAETGAALTIQLASFFGIPLSTTHTITTSIMGVGATQKLKAVKWGVAKNIVLAWILTFPICGLISFATTKIFALLF